MFERRTRPASRQPPREGVRPEQAGSLPPARYLRSDSARSLRSKRPRRIHRPHRRPAPDAGRVSARRPEPRTLLTSPPDLESLPLLRSRATRRTNRHTRLVTRIRSEEHTSELQSQSNLVCRLLLEKKNSTNSDRRHWTI